MRYALARGMVAGALGVACVLTAPAGIRAQTCMGDCGDDGSVTIQDLIAGVSIALGNQPVSVCHAVDGDRNGSVTVNELIRAVTSALGGCPLRNTPTETVAGQPTETPAPATPTPDAATPTAAEPTATEPPATETAPPPTTTATPEATVSARFCDLPGSYRHTTDGLVIVPGGPVDAPDLSFIDLPDGFCAHYYAKVGNPRQLRFAPGGELFVASPTTGTTGGGRSGQAGILVLPDDDADGVADSSMTFMGGLPSDRPMRSTQGLLFTGGYLYYQDNRPTDTLGTLIMRVPYAAGDRTPSGPSEQVEDITIHNSVLHWPRAMDIADDGTIYVANGGDQGDPCERPVQRFRGGILKLDGTPGGTIVARGFRNPISLRCARGHNRCYAIELTRDFTHGIGGREKLVEIREGDDWGFPCCATKGVRFPGSPQDTDCSHVPQDINSFIVGNTPFDLDFETGKWPEPWNNRVYVPLHGAYGTWTGARVIGISLDPITGEVLPGTEFEGQEGALREFAAGWDDGTMSHGRPGTVAFKPDGRLFVGNGVSGLIIWIAPLDLRGPAS